MKRDHRFDFYKGLLMIGVIWGHVIKALKYGTDVYPWIHLFVRTYDMPMFAFISGFFLRKSLEKHSTLENCVNKVGGILLPILLWTIITNLLAKQNLLSLGAFWFLWSLFWCSCILILVHGLLKKHPSWKNICFAGVILLCHVGLGVRWKIGFLLLPCVVGYYCAERREGKEFWPKVILVCLFVVMQCFWSLEYNVWNAGVNIFAKGMPLVTAAKIAFRTAIGITGCFVMKLVFDSIFDLMTESSFTQIRRVKQWIVSIGQKTLALYILQSIFVENWGARLIRIIVDMLGWNPIAVNARFLGYCVAPIVTVFSLIVLMWIQKWIGKIPYIGSVIFGVRIEVRKSTDRANL